MDKGSSFTRDIFTLLTGNAIAFLTPVVLYPVLSRIFDPADYAIFGLYSSLFAFLEIASAGRYDLTVVMPKQDTDAINLVGGGMFIALFYSAVIFLLVLFFGDAIALALNNTRLSDWLWLLPIGLIFISVNKLCNAWLLRIKKFRSASINKASQKVGEGIAQMVFGFLKIGNGLIVGDTLGRLLNAIFSIYQAVRYGLDRRLVSMASIRSNFKAYIEFPKYGILPSMLNALSGMMPVFIVSIYYSVDISGSFNFSKIMLSVPFAVIATGISQVLMQKVSERRNNRESIASELGSLATKLFGVGLAMTLILFFAGPALFAALFGDNWRVAGLFTSILVLSTAISLVVSPFSVLLSVLGRIKVGSYWQVFNFLVISSLWLLSDVEILNFLWVYVAIDLLSYALYGYLIYVEVRNYEYSLKLAR